MFCDNNISISLSKSLILHSHANYNRINHHFIRDRVQERL